MYSSQTSCGPKTGLQHQSFPFDFARVNLFETYGVRFERWQGHSYYVTLFSVFMVTWWHTKFHHGGLFVGTFCRYNKNVNCAMYKPHLVISFGYATYKYTLHAITIMNQWFSKISLSKSHKTCIIAHIWCRLRMFKFGCILPYCWSWVYSTTRWLVSLHAPPWILYVMVFWWRYLIKWRNYCKYSLIKLGDSSWFSIWINIFMHLSHIHQVYCSYPLKTKILCTVLINTTSRGTFLYDISYILSIKKYIIFLKVLISADVRVTS